MVTRKHIIIGGIALVGVVLVARRALAAKRPVCGQNAAWHVATATERELWAGKTSDVAESIRKWGGYCAVRGVVEDAGTRPVADDTEDAVLITHPWQLV